MSKPRIPVWSWRQAVAKTDVPTLTKALCWCIANYLSDAGKGAWPSLGRLVRESGMSERSIQTHLGLAEKAGLLVVRRKRLENGTLGARVFHPIFPPHTELVSHVPIEDGGIEVQPPAPSAGGPPALGAKPPARGSEPPAPSAGQEKVSKRELSTTPPAPSQARGARAKAKSLLSEDWELPDDWREWARKAAPTRSLWIASEADKFKDYHVGKGTRWADWRRAWQNWWRGACERPVPKGSMAAPAKPLPPDKTLAAPVWGREPDDDVRIYRADTPEFNSYVTRLIADGSLDLAEQYQQQGWLKERPSKVAGKRVADVVEKVRMIREGKLRADAP